MNKHVASGYEGKKPFKCDICDYSFSQKGNMKSHVASVHEGKKSFKCDIWDYSCSLKGHMISHVATVKEKKLFARAASENRVYNFFSRLFVQN